MLQQTPLVPPAATGTKPVSAVSSKCSEFPAEDIVHTGLRSGTEVKMRVLPVKLAHDALFEDDVLKLHTNGVASAIDYTAESLSMVCKLPGGI